MKLNVSWHCQIKSLLQIYWTISTQIYTILRIFTLQFLFLLFLSWSILRLFILSLIFPVKILYLPVTKTRIQFLQSKNYEPLNLLTLAFLLSSLSWFNILAISQASILFNGLWYFSIHMTPGIEILYICLNFFW